MGILDRDKPAYIPATGEANLRLHAKTTDELRKNAEVQTYPAYVRPSKDGPKVLVQNEAEHRIAVPADFPQNAKELLGTVASVVIDTIKKMEDVDRLNELCDVETAGKARPAVLEAIAAQIVLLTTDPTKPVEKPKGASDDPILANTAPVIIDAVKASQDAAWLRQVLVQEKTNKARAGVIAAIEARIAQMTTA